jgi:hypothetical protein
LMESTTIPHPSVGAAIEGAPAPNRRRSLTRCNVKAKSQLREPRCAQPRQR